MDGLRVHSNVLIGIVVLAIYLVRLDGEDAMMVLATSMRARIVSLGQLACGVFLRHDGSRLEDYLQDLRCFVLLVCPMRQHCNAMVV